MNRTKLIFGAVTMLGLMISASVVHAAGDGLPVFDYKAIVKYYDSESKKTLPLTYQAYLIINTNGTSSSVWYWGTTTATKQYYVVANDSSIGFQALDSSGNAYFSYGYSDMGFGKQTLNKKDGSYTSVSISGSTVDWSSYQYGTFTLKYDSSLTKKAIALGTNALDEVIINLTAKKYTEYID